MLNQVKAIGIGALVTLFLAVNVSSASAVIANFASEKYAANLTGTQTGTHTLETVAGKLECKSATFTGTLAAKSTTLSVTPSYAMCTYVKENATVAMNGCTFKIEAGGMLNPNEAVGGGLEIVCGAGKEVVVTAGKCLMNIPPTGEYLGFVNDANLAGGEIETKFNVVLTYKLNNACGVAEGEYTLGKLLGNYQVKGNNGWVKMIE